MERLETLSHSIEQLETYYIGLTSRYPPILEFLEEHISDVEDRIARENGITEEGSIRSWMESQNAQLNWIQSGQLKIVENIKAIISYGSDSEREIYEIKENTQDLEIYSLNAMVSAIKSGKDGGAFPYLTKEMQRVSMQSLQLSEDLSQKGQSLIGILTVLNERVLENTRHQSEAISELKEVVNTFIQEIFSCYEILEKHIYSTRKLHSKLKVPISQIVMEVQKQDIFRQSIDHIFLTHQQFDNFTLTSLEDELDYLKFSTDSYDFSRMVIEEVISDLENSISIFDSCHNEISLSAPSLSDFKSLEKVLTKAINCIHDSVQDQLNHLEKDRPLNIFCLENTGILDQLNEMQTIIMGILNKVEIINMINISNKIEITRNDEIPGIREAVKNVDRTSLVITKRISGLQDYIKNTRDRLTNIMNDYISNNIKYSDFLSDYTLNLSQFVDYFRHMGDQLIQQIQELTTFSESYKGLENKLDNDIQQTHTILLQMQSISDYFKDQKETFQDRFEKLLEDTEYDTWTFKNLKVQKLLDKFTIFTHRRAFFHQENDESQAALSGEITLF